MLSKAEREYLRLAATNWACGPGLVNPLLADIDELRGVLDDLRCALHGVFEYDGQEFYGAKEAWRRVDEILDD